MQRYSLVLLLVVIGVLAVVACASRNPTPMTGGEASAPAPAAEPANAAVQEEPAQEGSCSANPAWLSAPSLPSEVGSPQQACDFDQFMWQSLIALVQRSPDQPALVFETWMPTYGIFVKEGPPSRWGTQPPDACTAEEPEPVPMGSRPRVFSELIKQAGADQPLIALDGEFVYYAMSVNKDAYDMIVGCDLYKDSCAGALKNPRNGGVNVVDDYPGLAFPDGAVELKTSWKVLTAAQVASKQFYTTQGWIKHDENAECRQVPLGLLGMHIVSKTPKFPAFVWATFEHRNNAPDCDDLSAPPPLGGAWTLYDPSCTDCATNLYEEGKPAQVCRMHPYGDSSIGTFPGGLDCARDPDQYACKEAIRASLAKSTAAMTELNANVQALIAANPGQIDPVWANYELVGNMWTFGSTTPPYLQAQGGALSASNTSMETFVQNGVANVTNPYSCFSCHNMAGPTSAKPLPPAGLAHLFHDAQQPGGCGEGRLPEACTPYTNAERTPSP